MIKKKSKLLILIKLLFPILIWSQSDVKLSTFFLSPLTYNPAYSASYEGVTFTSLYSSQWVGFDGAPKTIFFNGHGTFFGVKTGLGFEIMHDEIGVTTDTKMLGNYAYNIELNDRWRLSMGIKAGFIWYTVDYNRLNIENATEILSLKKNINSINPNFGAGFILYNQNFFVGIGIPNFLKLNYLDSFKNSIANSYSNYYFNSGYKFYFENEVYLSPSILTRFVDGAPINTLFALTLNWQENFYFSLNLDLNTSMGGFVGLRFDEKILLGYSYDSSINNFYNSNEGIHSFFLNIRLWDYWQRERCGCYNF